MSAIRNLPETFKGACFRSGEDGYDVVREIWNVRCSEMTPTLIAQPADADDVALAVRFAADEGLSVAIRSGGHGVDALAMAHDALVIDMSTMKDISVDPESGHVTIEAGVLLGEMDAATQEHGLVVPAGTVTTTGAAGLTLGGGIGHLTRRHGASVDNLISVDVVTTDGRKLTASADSNPELFWGMRGAGHNLAVATSFTLQAHPVGPDVMSGIMIYSPEAAVGFLAGIDEAMTRAPRELSIPLVMVPAPPVPGMPEAMVGTPVLIAMVIYTGALDGYEAAIAPVRALAEPLMDMVKPSTWLEANALVDPFEPSGLRYHTGGGYLPKLSEEVAEIALERLRAAPAPTGPATGCMITFPMLGGALLDREEDATAFSRLGAEWLFEGIGMWDQSAGDEPYMRWVAETIDALSGHLSSNGYVNLTADRGPDWLRGVYGSAEKWDRIVALKREWDPHNLLCHNKNVLRAAELVSGL